MLRLSAGINALILAAFVVGSPNASAAAPYGVAGCGLGSVFFSPGGGQSTAATTNAFSGNQTFAITSGTSNCVAEGDAARLEEQQQFIIANLGTLSKEMARGDGEHLMAFTTTLGCTKGDYQVVATELQADYEHIFAAPGAMAVLERVKITLNGNESLSGRCKYIHI